MESIFIQITTSLTAVFLVVAEHKIYYQPLRLKELIRRGMGWVTVLALAGCTVFFTSLTESPIGAVGLWVWMATTSAGCGGTLWLLIVREKAERKRKAMQQYGKDTQS